MRKREPKRYHGPKTESVLTRDGFFLVIEWTRFGVDYKARVYEPYDLKLTDALADLMVLALEDRPEKVKPVI